MLHGLTRRSDVAVCAYALTWRGRDQLRAAVPHGVRTATRPIPARVVRELWDRGATRPRVEDWTGAVDVVHATNFVAPPARAPVVVTVHDVTFIRFPELCTAHTLRYPRLIERAIARGAIVHTPSEFVANEIRDYFTIPDDRVVPIHSGIPEVVEGNAARGAGAAGGARYVLALGTIEPRKNLTTLVKAFDQVARRDDDLRLVLAGPPGWDADRVTAAIGDAQNGDRIVRLGFVADELRGDLLAGATVFAYPSLYEGFGFPPLEAMRAGVPVVASTAGSLPEVLGDAALLVAPTDVDALAAAIEDFAHADPARSARVDAIERGFARVGRYQWDHTAARLTDLYRSLA